MSRIVVFGANGFIGRNLVKALSQNKEDSIVAFDRFSAYQRKTVHPFDDYHNVEVAIGDFFNRGDVSRTLEGADYVFHLVSSTTPASSNNDPFIDIETNARGSVELFDLCVEHKVKKVVFLSSGGTVYGDIDSDKIGENVVPAPRSPYGIGKLTIEHYLRYFKYVSGLDYIVYRVSNPYGPGQNIHGQQGVIAIFLHKILSGEPITVYGDGSMVRDYIYIDDLITMIMASYRAENKYGEYNLGSGKGETVNDVVSFIENCIGRSVDRQSSPTPSTFVQRSVMDTSRFTGEFGVKSTTGLQAGIKKTLDYVKHIAE